MRWLWRSWLLAAISNGGWWLSRQMALREMAKLKWLAVAENVA